MLPKRGLMESCASVICQIISVVTVFSYNFDNYSKLLLIKQIIYLL